MPRYFPASFNGFEVYPQVYSIVPVRRERHLTLRHQQQRACNLAEWLVDRRSPPPQRVAVVGGGLAGLTFAAAYKRHVPSACLRVIEKNAQLLPNIRSCEHRWLHPYFFSWPALGWEISRTMFPVLNWSSGTAKEVYKQILVQWEAADIPADRGRTVTRIEESNSGFLVSTRLMGGSDERRDEFNAIVLALGPGQEVVHDGATTDSYWTPDKLARTEAKQTPYVIAGSGDGALTDLFRLTIPDFHEHESICKFTTKLPLVEDSLARVARGERPTDEERQRIRRVFGDEGLRFDTRITLATGGSAAPSPSSGTEPDDYANAFQINQLLARALEAIGAFTKKRARVVGVADWLTKDRLPAHFKDKFIVWIDSNDPVLANGYVPRVGITPPTLIERTTDLTAVERAIRTLESDAWCAADADVLAQSADRARPPIIARQVLAPNTGRIEVGWVEKDALTIDSVRLRFGADHVEVNDEVLEFAVLQPQSPSQAAEDLGMAPIGVFPVLEPPDSLAAFRFAGVFASGVRLFLVGRVAGGDATLEAWDRACASFQLLEMAPTFAEFESEQPRSIGVPGEAWKVDLKLEDYS